MNYIKHLNAVFKRFSQDPRLNPTHISLSMALFQMWNTNRFSTIFYVHPEDIMKMSKIGSKVTYHRCLKNLNYWGYISYLPSHNVYGLLVEFEAFPAEKEVFEPIGNQGYIFFSLHRTC